MTIDTQFPGLGGVEWCQATNASGSTIVAGSGVVIVGGPSGAPVAGQQIGYGVPAFSFAIPGVAVTAGSLGILWRDIASGDTGHLFLIGLCGALSDGTGGLNQPLTIDTSGRLTLAVSGREVIAFGASAPSGGKIWARLVSPFVL